MRHSTFYPFLYPYLQTTIRACLHLILIALLPFHSYGKDSAASTYHTTSPYISIGIEQDELALKAVHSFHSYRWDRAAYYGKKMQRLEKKENLPPLSSLLLVSGHVLRILNNEYENEHEKKNILRKIDQLSSVGLKSLSKNSYPDSARSTVLLIKGGIKGFNATLRMFSNPLSALSDSKEALVLLEEAREKNPQLYDACLGPGIYHCVLAKSPSIVKEFLSLIGRDISLETGLSHLRTSAYNGHYTTDLAMLYLIQFLSPYFGHLTEEKNRLFRTLQSRYPDNPCYLFLEMDENLCFHPHAFFDFSSRNSIRKKILSYTVDSYSNRRYINLLKWQYNLIDPFPSPAMMPDTGFNLGEYSYYPVFLKAMREKRMMTMKEGMIEYDRKNRVTYIQSLTRQAMDILKGSQMHPSRKRHYLWHIRDALNLKELSQDNR